jgi:hypothetical protein
LAAVATHIGPSDVVTLATLLNMLGNENAGKIIRIKYLLEFIIYSSLRNFPMKKNNANTAPHTFIT